MNSKTAGAVRKMKDSDGRFLWAESLAAGQPARLMGYPVIIAEEMPDIASGANAIAFGDFGLAYTIAETSLTCASCAIRSLRNRTFCSMRPSA